MKPRKIIIICLISMLLLATVCNAATTATSGTSDSGTSSTSSATTASPTSANPSTSSSTSATGTSSTSTSAAATSATSSTSTSSTSSKTSTSTSSSTGTKAPSTTSSLTTTGSSAGSSDSSGSNELIPCSAPVDADYSSGLSSATPLDESINYSPFSNCQVSSLNVQPGSTGTDQGLALNVAACNTCGKKYTCSSVIVAPSVSFGTASWYARGAPSKAVATKMALTAGTGATAYELYVIIANSTSIMVGSTYPNERGVNGQSWVVSLNVDVTKYLTNFTIAWTDNNVQWYVGGIMVRSTGIVRFPSPLQASISEYVTTPSVIVNSTYAMIKSFNFLAFCNITKSNPTYRWAGSPLFYYMTNCTDRRPMWVYNDSMNDGWVDRSASFHNANITTIKHRGSSSFFFDLSADTSIWLFNNATYRRYKSSFLSFWMYCDQPSPQMVIFLTSNRTKVGNVNLGDYISGTRAASTWYKITIPLSKFIVNPSTTKNFDGLFFGNPTKDFQGQVYLDDIQINNGSICMEDPTPIYTQGKLADTMQASSQTLNIASNTVQYREHKTIQWYLSQSYDFVLEFIGGPLDLVDNNGLIVSLFFVPDSNTYTDPNDPSQTPNQPQVSIRLMNNGSIISTFGIVQYIGGEFPPNIWIQLSIPFEDFGLWPGANVDGIQFHTDGWSSSIQGTMYIGMIQAAKFVPPHSDDSSLAISLKVVSSTSILFVFISTILVTLVFI